MLPREFLRENAARLLREMPERFGGSGLETYTELDAERREAVTRSRRSAADATSITSLRGKPVPRALAEMKALKEEIRALEERVEEADRKLAAVEKQVPNVPQDTVPARHRRVRQPRRAHVGRAAPVRLRAPGALGPRPGARHPRLRARRQDRGRAIHGPLGRRRAPVARAHPVLPRRARRGARLPGGAAAFPRQRRLPLRHGTASQVRVGPLPDTGGLLPRSRRPRSR